MSNNAANSRYEDRAVFGERKKRTPAYGVKIAEMREELIGFVTSIRQELMSDIMKSERYQDAQYEAVKAFANALRAVLIAVIVAFAALAVAVIYLWVTR